MQRSQRDALRARYLYRCGFCSVSEADAGAELTVDHYQPRSHGGRHAPDNWVYCCHACNEFKGDHWQPESDLRILHPLKDDLAQHMVEREDGRLEALTETGEFHIQRLHLNRGPMVSHRRERRLVEESRQDQARLLQRLDRLEATVQDLLTELERLRDRDS